jgi:hypothetical protein
MSIINCPHCNKWIDTDFNKTFMFEIDRKNNIEQLEICEDCLIELEEEI